MMFPRSLSAALLLGCLSSLPTAVRSGNYDDAYNAAADDYTAAVDDYTSAYQNNDDYIKYWTSYAVLPKRCMVYNNVDVVVYSVFAESYNQCSDKPMGTYITPTPYFVDAYLDQLAAKESDSGNDDWATPDASQYTQCTQVEIQNTIYWVQIGCSDNDSQSLAVNIYSDNTCETRSVVDGYDDSNIDISEIQIPFRQCQACVNWVDKEDDNVDDMFYENRMTNAPLCSQIWQQKDTCNRKCKKMSIERTHHSKWNTSDRFLLTILSLFGAGMLISIIRKRSKMSNKDALLEQAAMSAAGLQASHVIGMFVLAILVITVFALLGLKNITWALLLMMNTCLFGYLMKLTVDSSVGAESAITADGTAIPRHEDSDEDSTDVSDDEPSPNAGTYALPQLA
mmetsp:Transcript_21234/g.38352  ORF Transcript_21234/g.38352 Transcript_21234/m.38352 type:complete len:396 (-) Transcript_21234:284-1471(-)|eukprot:CAMPEP_0198285574 /NCGR_PEP_ID=MMETSP1449-20131203/4831_1 /TAXON_ID=420275 /ORGANISM="Attheya septentrionalis, Strain CCMP2084" /LENGTH=395 /DNA_ID=CAMNT_0043983041 /DNA_START=161 /DNA_END=1348 /DNA_ORIENTATION=-